MTDKWLLHPTDVDSSPIRLRTAADPEVKACVDVPGAKHDFVLFSYTFYAKPRTSYVCVWCKGIACGDPDQIDPCMEVYHHTTDHVARSGERWPIGGQRPEPIEDALL